jgi:hypothetical protein
LNPRHKRPVSSMLEASRLVNNKLFPQQVANDEHASLEAFFQNPAEQDALAQAITVCTR